MSTSKHTCHFKVHPDDRILQAFLAIPLFKLDIAELIQCLNQVVFTAVLDNSRGPEKSKKSEVFDANGAMEMLIRSNIQYCGNEPDFSWSDCRLS